MATTQDPMTGAFDSDTAVVATGPDLFSATVTAAWNVGSAPNGGYIMAIGLRALEQRLEHPDPLTVTGHFLAPCQPGPVTVVTEQVRTGRTVSTGIAAISQDGRERLRLLGTFTDLATTRGMTHVDAAPPALPPPQACVRGSGQMPDGLPVEVARRFELRFPPGLPGWAYGAPTGKAELAGWVRFADGREPDPHALVLIADAFPPAVFELGTSGWVPTLELTVQVRRRPAPGWLRCALRTRFLTDGYLEEEAEIWDAEDRLVALSRQLARLRTPTTPGCRDLGTAGATRSRHPGVG